MSQTSLTGNGGSTAEPEKPKSSEFLREIFGYLQQLLSTATRWLEIRQLMAPQRLEAKAHLKQVKLTGKVYLKKLRFEQRKKWLEWMQVKLKEFWAWRQARIKKYSRRSRVFLYTFSLLFAMATLISWQYQIPLAFLGKLWWYMATGFVISTVGLLRRLVNHNPEQEEETEDAEVTEGEKKESSKYLKLSFLALFLLIIFATLAAMGAIDHNPYRWTVWLWMCVLSFRLHQEAKREQPPFRWRKILLPRLSVLWLGIWFICLLGRSQ